MRWSRGTRNRKVSQLFGRQPEADLHSSLLTHDMRIEDTDFGTVIHAGKIIITRNIFRI